MPLIRDTHEILRAFVPLPDAVAAARRTLRDHGLSADLDHTVSLLTSEIVGNAVRHSGGLEAGDRIVLHARLSEDHVRVEVADHGPCFDPEIRHTTDGFGLRMVDKLASGWGVERTAAGCLVWFEVDRRSRRFSR